MIGLNQNMTTGGIFIVLALVINEIARIYFAELASVLFLAGIILVSYGIWKSTGRNAEVIPSSSKPLDDHRSE